MQQCDLDIAKGAIIFYREGGPSVCGGGANIFWGGLRGGAKIFSRGQKGVPNFFQGVKGGPEFFSKRGANFFAPPAQFITSYNVKNCRAFVATFPNISTYTSLNFKLVSLSYPFLCVTSPLTYPLCECLSSPNDLLNPLTPFSLIRAYMHDEKMKA